MSTLMTFRDPLPFAPASLKALPRWVRWNAKKIPLQVSGAYASSTDPNTWASYEDAVTGAAIDKTQGVGFVVNGDGLLGVDLDGCRDPKTGEITEWAERIVEYCNSYTEITPSQTGLRVWLRGVIPGADKVFNLDSSAGFGRKVKIEVFERERYFTVTGDSYYEEPGDIESVDIAALYQMLHDIRAKYPVAANPKAVAADAGEATPIVYGPGVTFKTTKYDIFTRGIVDRQNGFRVSNGIGSLSYPSQSEADLGFATVLALVHDRDTEKMDADFRNSPLYRDKWEREDYKERTFHKALETANRIGASKAKELTAVEILAPTEVGATVAISDDIPAFDESAITGIYKQIVDLVTDGTTIPKQFPFLAAKVFIGARMAGKVTFENMDADSSYYGAVIAETGTGKGLAWRRTVENCLMVGESLKASVKIIQSADSGAGLKDAFFDDGGQALTIPVICYVDEATSLGHKAGEKKNPEIVDTIIELADGHRITRVLARNGKKSRANDNARLSLYMCGQNGEVFMQAFAGRTQLGLYDRLYPEYSPAIEAGDLPDIDTGKAAQVWTAINELLKTSGRMKMADGVKSLLDEFWKSQPKEHRNRVRWKKHLMLDTYMAAFGRGSMIATVEDWEVAKKLYLRQVAIREKHFTTEVPDKIGVYNSRLRTITERMRVRLKAGETVQQVALSQRDFMTATNAYRDNDVHTFNMAWRHWEGALLVSVPVTGGNGQKYTKFVPMPNEDETWKSEA